VIRGRFEVLSLHFVNLLEGGGGEGAQELVINQGWFLELAYQCEDAYLLVD